ncbi:origin recognition complex subunit Orc1 [Schizosaccharomyces pombe]|uniref:Origin recognition complex subunit 1 n=1 Tax=Schizosaccharomyces pombe (strain 972 / ATCC 24843) TaxID=284812 RepID=ORC1_SCHPO|nr:origin recognition complex subunit Orc1 [Schizosaccharomyces pombe]P54789.1 RecName: Full=Origin recognition complex subunit 1 [Schizosaccharomyces pombe 972h-]AAC49129.1 Orp1 [Schizosaccharomyces pombe]AAC49141.1 orc1+ protein [Schizosaccharomyces pombe]CAA22443.1 origin recognition complex subunit Orc1 [Schizosaccharomyces pombe]|eukprot:NP_596060.1 origin recognition complex subunit Orc1 [Schizosaccharomyces pombe]
MPRRKSLRSQLLINGIDKSLLSDDSADSSDIDEEEVYGVWTEEPFQKEAGRSYYRSLKKNDVIYRVGDDITVHDGDSSFYLGVICKLYEKAIDKHSGKKYVEAIWYSRAYAKRMEIKPEYLLPDRHINEVYVSCGRDENLTSCIIEHCNVYSEAEFFSKFPAGIPTKRKDLFPCNFFIRRGVHLKVNKYTEPLDWSYYAHNLERIEDLLVEMEENLRPTKKKSGSRGRGRPRKYPLPNVESKESSSKVNSKDENFDLQDDSESSEDNLTIQPQTPRRRHKRSRHNSSNLASTPKRNGYKQPLQITPLPIRMLSLEEFQGSPHRKARAMLHVASVPSTLQCRDNEFSTIFSNLESAIEEETGACLYISGTPGTGKTATVHEVIWNLQELSREGQLPEFSFCEINGMRVTSANQAYSILWESLTGERVTPIHAMDLLDNRFTHASPNRSSCVVLMDELDQLVTHNQKVLYNFFNWPSLPHSRLIVVAVANTMDLPERILSNRISSRLGLSRVPFEPYTHTQLEIIIAARLEAVRDDDVFSSDAIRFAARKVAAVSGDARRALDICRRASELAENKNGKVTPGLIHQAISEMTASPLQKVLRNLSFMQKVFLCAIVNRMRRSGFAESYVYEVLEEAERLLRVMTTPDAEAKFGELILRRPEFGYVLSSLSENGVLYLENKSSRNARVRLAIADDEIKLAFRGDSELAGIA